MAQLKGFGIDLGQHSVKLVELRKDRAGVHLARAKVVSTGAASAASKEARDKAVSSALKEALEGVDVGQNPVAIATPGLSAFIRYVKLPPVTPQRLKQIIGYEAQQQVPFPLNEVTWDYQVLDVRTEAETNVVLVAIKRDVLSSLISLVKTCGIEPSFIEHRPLAVYNSIKFNYGAGPEGVVVIIDAGERTTDISVEKDGELCWTRSARTGSADITEAVRKKYGVDSEEAERIKEEAVVLTSPADEKSADEKTLELWNTIKGPVSSIASELQRTVNYFQTQLGGDRADRIIVTGGLSLLRGVDSFLGAVIGADVEKLDPLQRISAYPGVLGGIDAGANLSVALGLGLRSVGEGFSTLNLLPESIVSRQELRKKRAYLALSGVSLALMVGISFVFSHENYNAAKRNVAMVKEDLDEYQKYNRLIREERSKQDSIDSKAENLQKFLSGFWSWPDFLLEVARGIPEGITVSGLGFVAEEARRDVRRDPRRDTRRMDPADDFDYMYEMDSRRAAPAAAEPGRVVLELTGTGEDFDKISKLISMFENSGRFKSVRVVSAAPVTVLVSRETGRVISRERRELPGEEAVQRDYIDFTVRVEVEGDRP